MDRRNFLKMSLAVAASLAGCDSLANDLASSSTGTLPPLFPGELDPLDLTAPGEMPPTEIPGPERFFGPDPATEPRPTTTPTTFLDTFEHVVVLQLENRSLDNLFGYLYPTGVSPSGDPFNGVAGKSLSNRIPPYAPDSQEGLVPVSRAPGLPNPVVDPPEQWTAINLALYNQFNPPSNQFSKEEDDFAAPYNLPAQGAYFPPPMTGFVTAFYWRLLSLGHSATYDDYATVMQSLTPPTVPAISQVAQQNMVCDNWFCGIPSQTYCNRALFHAGSSAGFLINAPFLKWVLLNDAPTIFESLTAAGRSWTIYYDALDILPFTRFLHYPRLRQFPNEPPFFQNMVGFYVDVEAGALPDYSFIQPRFLFMNNSYHPDYGAPACLRGEVLVNDIYQAIRMSNNANGSNFLNTLFVITFDEGGTCFDHVPPPPVVAPGDGYTPEYGFDFRRLGQRIPTILISPWLEQGSVISTEFHATSLIRTLQQKFGLGTLTQRDAASTSLQNLPFLSTPRTRTQMPRLRLRRLSEADRAPDGSAPLRGMAAGLVGMVHAALTGQPEFPAGVNTIQDGIDHLQQAAPLLRD
ncbi:MAG: hypothetical protein HY319_19870 [Armatimonadetes bacterium]|nr:hypothetical protein [Armatimonadota bacterium]